MKVPLHTERYEELMNCINRDIKAMDKYLPDETMQVCTQLMSEIGGLPSWETVQEMETPYFLQYNHLRTALRKWKDEEREPYVGLLPTPTEGVKELINLFKSAQIQVDTETGSDIRLGTELDSDGESSTSVSTSDELSGT